MTHQKAFTLPELLVATTIILLTSLGILFTYIQCLEINNINHDTLKALASARNQIETIKATPFDQIHDTYNNQTFPLDGITGIGTTDVNDKNPELLEVTVKCFWRQAKGRLIGEDKNLNGRLDQGEDLNKNGELDSPVSILTYLYKR